MSRGYSIVLQVSITSQVINQNGWLAGPSTSRMRQPFLKTRSGCRSGIPSQQSPGQA